MAMRLDLAPPRDDKAWPTRVRCIVAAALLVSCAHLGRRGVLTTDEELVASALSWAVRVPPRAAEYKVVVPAVYREEALLAAAAAEAGLRRRGTTLLSADAAASREPVRITVETPQRVVESAAREFRVPFAVAVGGGAPTRCVVRIRLRGDDRRSWIYASEPSEGGEHCWPRPGAWSKP
jgi:hypothetical protein